MNIEDEIKQYITAELFRGQRAADLSDDDKLVSSGRVDSMALLQILSFVQQRFGVDLMSVGDPHDFDSVKGLAAAVRRNSRHE